MSSFDISLSRTFIDHDGSPVEVWYATVDNADAYGRGQGETPAVALRQLADEFEGTLRGPADG